MEELETKKYAGIDLGRTSVQFSIYREGQEEMTEESFLLSEEEQKEYIESGMRQVERYMDTGGLRWPDFQAVFDGGCIGGESEQAQIGSK